jgi:uncharacterized protein
MGRSYLAYNTLLRTAATLNWKLKNLIEDGENIDTLPPSISHKLLKIGILSQGDKEDEKKLEEVLTEGYNPDYFFPVIAYTAKCNLNCVYCFEEGVDRSVSMSPAIVEATIMWMKKYVIENGPFGQIHMGLFGGEPLIDVKTAHYIIDAMRDFARSRNMELAFDLTTNGVLMKKNVIEGLVEKGLQSIQITLDGPPRIHDARRKFRNGEGTFEIILENLKDAAEIEELALSVEVNIDRQNIEHFGELLSILADNGLKDRIRLSPEPTLETQACIGRKEHHCSRHVLKGSDLINAFKKVMEEVSRHGFHTPEIVGVSYPCIFVEQHHYVIDFHGDIYRCSFTIGNRDFIVGNVTSGFNWKNQDMLSSRNVIKNCMEKKCGFVPICGGGCRYEAWANTGSYHSLNCKKDIIQAILPLSLRQYFIGQCTPLKLK